MGNDPLHPEPEHRPASGKATAGSAPGHEPARGVEDASARALSEALRSSFNIVKLLMLALVAAFILSGVFTVKPNEVAIKLRFGQPVGAGAEQLLKPGLHWKFPYPIDDVVYVPVGQSHTVISTAGWYAQTPEEAATHHKPQPLGMHRPGVDGYTLTGDGDIIHAKATLSYRINDPVRYTFQFANATNLLQHILDNALFYVSARFTADDALYRKQLAFQEAVQARVAQRIEQLNLGVRIESGEVRTDTEPPIDVNEAFNKVTEAQQQGDIKIQEAESYARVATNKAVGDATVILRGALTSSNYLVTTVAAEADRFGKLLPRYEADRELFKQRLLSETMARILTNAQYKVFLPERADGNPWDLRLQLGKEPEIPKKETSKTE